MTFSRDSYKTLLQHWHSSYSAADYICKSLNEAGFQEVLPANYSPIAADRPVGKVENGAPAINAGGKYYFRLHKTLIIAGIIGTQGSSAAITACHTDVPGLAIKQGPAQKIDDAYWVSTEIYGGPILNTWFDKPLGLSISVNYSSNNQLKHSCININRPVGVIPNLAIHLNREVNNGTAIDNDKHLQVCIPKDILQESNSNDEEIDVIKTLISDELNISESDVLSYEAFLYPLIPSSEIGNSMILAKGIDNSASSSAILSALCQNEATEHHQIGIFFDHEEIGSLSVQGGQSSATSFVLKELFSTESDSAFFNILRKSFCLSIDGAQGYHPLYADKFDSKRAPILGKGVAIKNSTKRGYATNAESSARLQFLFKDYCFQQQYNHSNEKGGTTLGPLLQLQLPLNIVDLGIPMLAMHSTSELAQWDDILDLHHITSQFLLKGC